LSKVPRASPRRKTLKERRRKKKRRQNPHLRPKATRPAHVVPKGKNYCHFSAGWGE